MMPTFVTSEYCNFIPPAHGSLPTIAHRQRLCLLTHGGFRSRSHIKCPTAAPCSTTLQRRRSAPVGCPPRGPPKPPPRRCRSGTDPVSYAAPALWHRATPVAVAVAAPSRPGGCRRPSLAVIARRADDRRARCRGGPRGRGTSPAPSRRAVRGPQHEWHRLCARFSRRQSSQEKSASSSPHAWQRDSDTSSLSLFTTYVPAKDSCGLCSTPRQLCFSACGREVRKNRCQCCELTHPRCSTVASYGFQLWIDTYVRGTQRRFVGRRQRYACVKMHVIRETVLDDDVTGAGKSR
jgi:hypothetical protein